MNTWELGTLGKLPMLLWRRFHIWHATQMYRRVLRLEAEAQFLTHKADELMRKHAEDPQSRLPLGDD